MSGRILYLVVLKAYKAKSRLVLASLLLAALAGLWLIVGDSAPHLHPTERYYLAFNLSDLQLVSIPTLAELRMRWIQKKLDRLSKKMEKLMLKKVADLQEMDVPNDNIHIFYFAWFRNIEEDGFWNHWQSRDNLSSPPSGINSEYYPMIGCYSSRNISVIEKHMKLISRAGIGVIILSWAPLFSPDSPVTFLTSLINIAHKHELKIALHIENHEQRTLENIFEQVKYFISKYGNHPAVYRLKKNGYELPVFYIHETFQIEHLKWKRILTKISNATIRGTLYDGFFFAHLSEQHQGTLLKAANFDGFYTYSSANGMSYGSSWKNWPSLAKFAKEKDLMFIPCVGPGYAKGFKETRHRLHGDYYEVGWRSALAVKPRLIGINSFNDWQAGNQIEPAKPWKGYLGYEPEGHDFYLNLTLWWVKKFSEVG